jgi:Hint domain
MADVIFDINFSGVTITETTSGSHTGTLGGTLQVDYTTNTATLATDTPALTFSGDGIGGTHMYETFHLAQSGTSYTLTSTSTTTGEPQTLTFTWTNHDPKFLNTASIVEADSGHTFSILHTDTNHLMSVPVCFAAGTLIRTPRGDVAVETLKAGDLVETASGELRPVKWLGHRKVSCRAHPDPRVLFPVRVARDAFGPNRPSQDLYVSTGHSICIDLCGEVLIPASNLINGATIAQIEVDEVSYWHVELDSHDILVANNLPTESYLAMGNRRFFEEAGATLDALDEGGDRTQGDFCRPVVLDGAVLDFVRRRLLARAEAIGWTPSHETDLHLAVDGEVYRPLSGGGVAVFLFPANARDVRLMSNTFIPALVGGADPRSLGLSLVGLVFSGGRGEARPVSLDDERLKGGLHHEEAKSGARWRWTKGELILNPEFWGGFSGHVALTVTSNDAGTRQWVAAPKADVVLAASDRPPKLYAVQ